jgi:hypothetical protein
MGATTESAIRMAEAGIRSAKQGDTAAAAEWWRGAADTIEPAPDEPKATEPATEPER